MKKTIKTLALFTTGLVVGVVVGRVDGIRNQNDYMIIDLEKANYENIIDVFKHLKN